MSASNPAAGPELVKASQQERHLSIHDALEYLDTIKAQFANEPEVYNNFLDIMKDFKGKRRVPLLHVAVKLYRSGRTDRVSDVRHTDSTLRVSSNGSPTCSTATRTSSEASMYSCLMAFAWRSLAIRPLPQPPCNPSTPSSLHKRRRSLANMVPRQSEHLLELERAAIAAETVFPSTFRPTPISSVCYAEETLHNNYDRVIV